MNTNKLALALYALLAGALLLLAGWLISEVVEKGVEVDMVAFLSVIFMAFRDVISKMGDTVRVLNAVADEPPAEPAPVQLSGA